MQLRLQYYIHLQEVALQSLSQAELEVGRRRSILRRLDHEVLLEQDYSPNDLDGELCVFLRLRRHVDVFRSMIGRLAREGHSEETKDTRMD